MMSSDDRRAMREAQEYYIQNRSITATEKAEMAFERKRLAAIERWREKYGVPAKTGKTGRKKR